ncbi:helix-turn-helix transcriptional regulator [Jiangella muralis]|uniref:helix-turn-helix transcriptional regulator n=1 Tax=Jiangella muralis TaxID=702383 RepID=UPI00069FFF00|nr:AraC family transcriptional regulator [Jiangella muralis]
MQLEVVRLGTLLDGAPFYANSIVLRRHAPHRHHDYVEVMAITAGEGEHAIISGGRVVERSPMTPGQLYLFRPRDVHSFEATTESGLGIINVAMPVSVWQRFASLTGLDPSWSRSSRPPMVTFEPGSPLVMGPLESAVERFHSGQASMLDLLRFWGDIIPLLLPAPRQDQPGFGAPTWLLAGVDAMLEEENLREGVPRLLQLAYVSPAHLSRVTRQYFGMTPTDLVANLRIRHATMLLSTSLDSVSRIAERCGFSSPSYFSNCFRRATLMSPREYRSRLLGGYFGTPRQPPPELTSGR